MGRQKSCDDRSKTKHVIVVEINTRKLRPNDYFIIILYCCNIFKKIFLKNFPSLNKVWILRSEPERMPIHFCALRAGFTSLFLPSQFFLFSLCVSSPLGSEPGFESEIWHCFWKSACFKPSGFDLYSPLIGRLL